MSALSYMPLLTAVYSTTTIYLFAILLYTSVLVSTNNYSVVLYNCDLQTRTVFFTRNFTQGWLNSYYSSPALSCLYTYTYIHNWLLQSFSQDYWPSFSHHLCGVCYSLQSTPNDRFFEKLFHGNFLFASQSFCQKSTERKSPKKYFSYFILMSRLELETCLFV